MLCYMYIVMRNACTLLSFVIIIYYIEIFIIEIIGPYTKYTVHTEKQC